MLIWEIFDSKLDLEWQRNGKFELAKFMFDEIPFMIQVEEKLVSGGQQLSKSRVAEVSFFREDRDDTEAAFSTTNETKFPVKIYGVVANALLERFSKYDAFYFTAEARHSQSRKEFKKKCDIYELIADRLAKKTGATLYVSENVSGSEFLASKVKLENTRFKNPLQEALKAVKFTNVPTIRSSK